MNLCNVLLIGLGLFTVAAPAPPLVPDNPNNPPPATITWSQLDTYQMTGSSWNWFQAKQNAANYVGPGTDGVTYSDWRLPTKAEYEAGINPSPAGTPGITGQWSFGGTKWTSQSKGSQQSWCAQFTVDANGLVPNQTVQFAYFNSTYSFISAKYVRP